MTANTENLYNHVAFLTSIFPYRNYKNIDSLQKTATYIEKRLKDVGLPTARQKWEAKGNIYENVIATYQPQKTKRFIIGAHYDVYKDIAGADDNASSVAGLLEISRMLAESSLNLDYGIDIVFFCLEEPPFFKTDKMGSHIHAKSIAKTNKDYIGMIALEMIGYYREVKIKDEDSTFNKNQLIVSGIKKFDEFNRKVSYLLKANGTMGSRRVSFAEHYPNNGPSDHRNYWEFDIPAVMIIGTGGEGNPNYHTPTDTIETLDFEIMTNAVNCIAHALFNFFE
ncbi:M28 family peptidase [Aequorivita xiaoshiensis]|uniref:M28 family peptidase n=1 Tax=Aequorivita xiaoshiensis TaxID=2874476 RepID=A0A9X1R125_9FLAO|nr:M28 family peptidase [Aequorivita xiaoshiensis]MCG2430316.1 M28 family peptidase [Aequorivita xiaoshiensis]